MNIFFVSLTFVEVNVHDIMFSARMPFDRFAEA